MKKSIVFFFLVFMTASNVNAELRTFMSIEGVWPGKDAEVVEGLPRMIDENVFELKTWEWSASQVESDFLTFGVECPYEMRFTKVSNSVSATLLERTGGTPNQGKLFVVNGVGTRDPRLLQEYDLKDFFITGVGISTVYSGDAIEEEYLVSINELKGVYYEYPNSKNMDPLEREFELNPYKPCGPR